MNEDDTRAELIDPQLAAAGWVSNPETGVRVRRGFYITDGEISAGGHRKERLFADYVLEYNNIKLAVVEAKSNEKDVSEGVAQAKNYAKKLRLKTSFAANGKHIYQMNHSDGTEGNVSAFPSPQELWDKTFGETNDWLKQFNAVPFEDMNGTKQARYYQELAVNKAVEAIAEEKQRVLLILATGTGKTFIAFQIAWKLFKTRWTLQRDKKRQPRILFLADRNILANQAFLDFDTFQDDALVRINPNEIRKKGEVPKNGSFFFTIFQTFMSGEGEERQSYFHDYEKDFFDLVIIDECHRGGANDESNRRDILNHFDSAVHLGLTATPKRDDNVDTYDYFGDPVFIYSLREGIQDGFLTPFKVKRVMTNIDEYVHTPDDEVLQGEVKQGFVYTEGDFNRSIEIKEREEIRVKSLLAEINQNEKTIVFCASQAHAALIRDLINQKADSKAMDYCVRVTSDEGKIGDTHLDNFKDNEKLLPTILTTSQKLTTGVDARNVRNIVLLRKINSMIEFKQIIGRGTRLFEGKHYFTILDFAKAYHLFNDPEWDGEPIEPEIVIEKPPQTQSPDQTPPVKEEEAPKAKLKIKLGDNKTRELDSITSTFFFADGKPVGAEDFLKRLFDTLKLPDLFGSEAELRKLWANPVTRRELLDKLEKVGFRKQDLEALQPMINAEDSDLFDVLEYIAYATPPVSRAARVETNKDNIFNLLNEKQAEFIDYVLRNYVKDGVDELDDSKLSKVLIAKYGSLHAAQEELGAAAEIKETFIGFQQFLYDEAAG